jgi:hypothetical protein
MNRRSAAKFWPIGRDQFPIRYALRIQDMNIHNANSIGADVFISWIEETDQICTMNIRHLGVYMASPIAAVITERNISTHVIFCYHLPLKTNATM